MAIDPNVFYRAGAIKGQLNRQRNQNRGRALENFGNQVGIHTKAILAFNAKPAT